MNSIDTSIDGFKYVGINLSEEQYNDLRDLNELILTNEHRQNIPVFNTMIVLKILGLLPSEMINNERDDNSYNNSDYNVNESLERKFGKIKDWFFNFFNRL